jgi:hypothetical protein
VFEPCVRVFALREALTLSHTAYKIPTHKNTFEKTQRLLNNNTAVFALREAKKHSQTRPKNTNKQKYI